MEFVKAMYSLDFSHPSLGVYSFATPHIKLKLGQQIGGGLLPNIKPPGPIIIMGPIRNTQQQLDHIYYTLFYRCTVLLRLSLPAMAMCTIMGSQNHFPNQTGMHTLDFFIQFYCAGSHIEHRWRCSNKRMWFFPHKKIRVTRHMYEINFRISSITMYNM